MVPRSVLALSILVVAACGDATSPSAEQAPLLPEPIVPRPEPVDAAAADAALALGRRALQSRRFPEAREAFTRSTELDPGRAEAFYLLGQSYVVSAPGMTFSTAIEHFRHALALDPKYTPAHWGIGAAAYGLSDYTTARQHLRQVVVDGERVQAEQLGEARYFLGVMELNDGNSEAAIEHLAEARRLYPQFSDSRYQMGLAYEELGDDEKALEAFEETTQIDPNHAGAHHRLSRVHSRAGRDELARREEEIHDLLNQLTDNTSSRFAADHRTRLELQEKLITIYPENYKIRLQHAQLLLTTRRPFEAARVLDSLIREMPEVAGAYVTRAEIALRMGDRSTAKQRLQSLFQAVPEFPRRNLSPELLALLDE